MKTSHDIQRAVMEYLVQGGGARSFARILMHMKILEGVHVGIDMTEKTVCLHFSCADGCPTEADRRAAHTRAADILYTLVQIFGVLSDLEKKRLAVSYVSKRFEGYQLTLGTTALRASAVKVEICDPAITELFTDYLGKEIVPSPELRRLARRGLPLESLESRHQGHGMLWAGAMLVCVVLIGSMLVSYQRDQTLLAQLNTQATMLRTQGQIWSTGLERVLANQSDNSTFQKETTEHLDKLSLAVDGLRQEMEKKLREPRPDANPPKPPPPAAAPKPALSSNAAMSYRD